MRCIRYSVASSLDGYIAGPDGEYDWIPGDPDIDFAAMMSRYDTYLMGRKTYEMMQGAGGPAPAGTVLVFSRTLKPEDHPKVTIVSDDIPGRLRALRDEPGKDIWLFGGGELFRSLLELNEVDEVEVGLVPVLLGRGIPLLPAASVRAKLRLASQRVYEKSGIVLLTYAVEREPPKKTRGGSRAKAL